MSLCSAWSIFSSSEWTENLHTEQWHFKNTKGIYEDQTKVHPDYYQLK